MKETMEEYAKKRNGKSGEVRSVSIRKADGGFIVDVSSTDFEHDQKPKVYKDLAGVYKCLADKFGGKK